LRDENKKPQEFFETIENVLTPITEAMSSMTSPASPASPAQKISPQYPDTSPAYVPPEEEQYGSPSSSPQYIPMELTPQSPEYSPQSDNEKVGGDRISRDYLSEAAKQYALDDKVYYRGDPNRIWTITNIGDKFIRIETNDYSNGATKDDNLKIVSALDIYPAENKYDGLRNENIFKNDITQTQQPNLQNASTQEYQDVTQQPMMLHNPNVPYIHFAPTIKVTGANDFSGSSKETQPENSHVEFIPTAMGNAMGNAMENALNDKILVKKSSDTGSFQPSPQIQQQSTVTEQPKTVDFNNLVIKKSG
jgi:hypothetical protein